MLTGIGLKFSLKIRSKMFKAHIRQNVWSKSFPSGHMTLIQRRLNADATSWRCIDIEPTLYKRHVPTGLSISIILLQKKTSFFLFFLLFFFQFPIVYIMNHLFIVLIVGLWLFARYVIMCILYFSYNVGGFREVIFFNCTPMSRGSDSMMVLT